MKLTARQLNQGGTIRPDVSAEVSCRAGWFLWALKVVLAAVWLWALALVLSGCTVCTANRVFPKLTWSWSHDAQLQRESDARQKAYIESLRTNQP